MPICVYCAAEVTKPAEHWLPRAFGRFGPAALLDRVCAVCSGRLGHHDEELVRATPEGLLREHLGVRGRSRHRKVAPLYEPIRGDYPLWLLRYVPGDPVQVLMELPQAGKARPMRQVILTANNPPGDGLFHLRIADDVNAPRVAKFVRSAGLTAAEVLRVYHDDDDRDLPGIRRVLELGLCGRWGGPHFRRGMGSALQPFDPSRHTARVRMSFTEGPRYHRAILKLGFHYFLWAFPGMDGSTTAFAAVRQALLEDGNPDEFVETRGPTALPGFPDPADYPHILLRAALDDDRVLVLVRMPSSLAWRVELGPSPSPLFLREIRSYVACYTRDVRDQDGVILTMREFQFRCDAGVRIVEWPPPDADAGS